ncbi:NADPH-dependent FMN reductase [Halopenitus persicus]|uniref:NAD(P)H-dependent FMN reductase n=1 Tax=Halopenitus persicus TaxID=1048396 RepID=A0A1H3DMY9_9EURY|nr:NAD(P)H-dependent oxidoreductase [Halopenitus persicus]QHS16313.1 NAD(P)H-dependent oxidoreductase [haloarchaeon 3A1-DGR]SDX67882.1 NAD(P)H-dependent FMN reductase [Halopenitus persicus]
MDDPHVVGVVGSLRSRSRTRVVVRTALEGADTAGATTELLDLREYDLPPLNPDVDDQGDGAAFRSAIRDADAVILGTPMYHGSCSGVLKNALDHCGFEEFEGVTVGLVAVAGGSFPITALEHLRSVCRALDAWVLPYQAAVPRAGSTIDGGSITDRDLRERVETLGDRVVAYRSIEPEPSTFESDQNKGA